MKMYLKESLQLVEDNIIIAHKGTIIAAALLYVLSIIVMYNSNNEHLTIAVARMLLYNASIMFIAAETLRLAKNWTLRTKFIIGVFAIEVLGYLLMTVAACREEYYNRGIMFMLASFLISISKELSIVSLLVPNNQLKSKRYHFLSSLNSCCSALVFFFSALVSNFWGEQWQRQMISSGLNMMSGLLMCLSVFYSIKGQHYEGYSTMELSMSDER